MNSQEREVISDIFRRLEQVAQQPRDPEAERFINDKIRQQPYAPYAMAQAIYVQEQALANLHAQVQELGAEIERLGNQPQQSGGFLSSLFGGGRQPERPAAPMGAPFGSPAGMQPGMDQPGPWGRQGGAWGREPGMMGGPGRGSGFLGTAMMTAAGVAGGVVLGNALASAFGGGGHGGLGALGRQGNEAASTAGDHSDLSPFGNPDDARIRDASVEDGGDYDLGGDAGDDWA